MRWPRLCKIAHRSAIKPWLAAGPVDGEQSGRAALNDTEKEARLAKDLKIKTE
jgi:hypothetical protein